MNTKKLSVSLMSALLLSACDSASEDPILPNTNDLVEVSFGIGDEFTAEDAVLTRAATSFDYYYVAVSANAASSGNISSGYVGYFTSLTGVSLTLPKGTYNVYISAYKQQGYTIDWSSVSSSLTTGSFTEVSAATATAPDFADQKVDRYYGSTSKAINANTIVTVNAKRFAYGVNVDIEKPLEGKVVLSSTSPSFSYTATTAAVTASNLYSLAGTDATTASKTMDVTMTLYDAQNAVVATQTKTITIARNHSKTLKVKALDPKATFEFAVEDEDMTNDGDEEFGSDSSTSQQPTGATNGHDYVDLGITDDNGNPIYWATCNVGASAPEEYGLYFAWGATTGCDNTTGDCTDHTFNWANDPFNGGNEDYIESAWEAAKSGAVDANNNLLPSNDAATANWGGIWRMPTYDELDKLRTECYRQWVESYNGKSVNGYVVYKAKASADKGKSPYWDDDTSSIVTPTPEATYSVSSDAHIFLPAAGSRSDSSLYNAGSNGIYWSSTHRSDATSGADCLFFYSSYVGWFTCSRYCGQSVRPVCQ